ncbi:MAG: hypothetical protein JXR37_32760 [Kiritimatiellae bacterium]|nr:hypothetical protein [Kiritimatiellia bacterium]
MACWTAVLLLFVTAGCRTVPKVPVEVDVKPIHVTVDVNIKVEKVDKELENFFSDAYAPAAPDTAKADGAAPNTDPEK